MELCCGITFVLIVIAAIGHALWVTAAAALHAVFGSAPPNPGRPYRYCPACGTDPAPRDRDCPHCGLDLDGQLAHRLHRVRVAQREVTWLRDNDRLAPETADAVLAQLDSRVQELQDRSAEPVAPAPARPVAAAAPDTPEPIAPATAPERAPAPIRAAALEAPAAPERSAPPAPLEPPPGRRGPGFLEAHNILWGELVGGLLIVGCSIALVVTLRQTLEAVLYFRFLLSASVTLALFGAGQYTLHRWKLSGTSRGMLVISLLLTPLTLLLLAAPFTEGAPVIIDLAVKVTALAAFVGVVRTGGRDLIGTEHLPGPVDRRWLLALAVVGAAGTQLLPAPLTSAWLPFACYAAACAAALGGLSWYHPGRRAEPIPDKSGAALLMFVGLAAFALAAAWGLHVVRASDQMAARLAGLAVPLALAGVPVVEAGVLVLRRVASAGLRTTGTAVALAGFGAVTTGLALAWPAPPALLLIAGTIGGYLTRVAFRERLPWVQAGAVPLLALAVVLGSHGLAGNWTAPPPLGVTLGSAASGAVLAGFALVLGWVAEVLARRASHQTASYATGALAAGTFGLLLVSWHGTTTPAVAAGTHAACALGLLASNYRWQRRALAHGGVWLVLVGTMWALWWQAPGRPDRWGFVIAAEALALAVGAALLRDAHGAATRLLRRAGRDVAFAAGALALVAGAASLTLDSPWHTGTLFGLALTSVALARLTGWPPLTWVGSGTALLGCVHLGAFTWDAKPETLAVEIAILAHAALATLAAVLCRRQARVFGDPFRWSAQLSTALAVPLLLVPAAGYAFAAAGLAVWLGVLWLVFALVWRERGGFSAFQSAVTLAALLTAFGWIERQEWWRNGPAPGGPRPLHAFGFALGTLALVWAVARRAVRHNARARELWCGQPRSLDRLVLGTTVIGFLVLGVVAVLPGVRAELTPIGSWRPLAPPAELAHAFGRPAFYLCALLGAAVVLSWRLSELESDTDVHATGLALLALAAPVLWAGTYGPEVATASALRWGLAVAFVAGSMLVALRVPVRRGAEAMGFMVRPSPLLRPVVLGLLATAAGGVLLPSALGVELGLNHLKPGGPLESSVFARMGMLASSIAPLALVIIGLAVTAAREQSSKYALFGGLVFVGTLTAGYALAVVTAGGSVRGAELTRIMLIIASAAAVWALVWQWVEWRVPGGDPLTVQVLIGLVALAVVCSVPGARLIGAPDVPLAPTFAPLGVFGWTALVLVAGAGVWHARRVQPQAVSLVLALAGLIAGVLSGAAAREWDGPGRWVAFHAAAGTWAAVGFIFFVTRNWVRLGTWWLTCFAALLVLCAFRAGWYDPWRPWVPAGLALGAALFLGAVALRTRAVAYAGTSGLAVNLAAVFVWVAWAPESVSGFCLANAAGFAAAVVAWTLVRMRSRATPGGAGWLDPLDAALAPAFAFLVAGLAPTLAGSRFDPPALTWGALAAVATACAIGLWDRAAAFARPGLFTAGALAALLIVCEADLRPVWTVPVTALALAGYALGTASLARARSQRTSPLLGIPARADAWLWLLGVLPVLALLTGLTGLQTGLTAPERLHRLANPAGMALLALSFAVLTGAYANVFRPALRTTGVALAVYALAALAWAVPDPSDAHVWLHRNGWLFVALAGAAVAGGEGAPRLGGGWRGAVRGVAGWAAVAAGAVLCLNLLQQFPAFNPVAGRTPLSRESALAMLAGTAGLVALALRFALAPDRDPFRLRPVRRTVYVYLAEVLVVLFFVQVRFNVPKLFLGDLAKLWTFAVMALAYAGIGLAELFERKKLDVLALPLRRTGALLPLVPLVAFWAKPPAAVSTFARNSAPGLEPLLGYLEKLPQHFDTYAWLWFLAGGVYGLVALSKRSFGWALLAALSTNAAMWALLAHNGVPFFVHPQAWVIPLALIVLVSEHINRHRLSAAASGAMRHAGVAMIYVASAADMFLAGVGASKWLPVILAALCVLGVLAGIVLRLRAFVYLGVGFLLLDLFAMIWHAAVNLQQTWVWYASGIVLGVIVLALFAYLEKQRGPAGSEPVKHR